MFNWTKAFMLMAAIIALFIVVGGMTDRHGEMILVLLFALDMNFFSYWLSNKMVLRVYNAQEVNETSAPQFYRMVQELVGRAGLPMPRIYLIDEAQPNAFATGRNPEHAVVAAATGTLNILSECGLRGAMARELTHVQYRNTLILTISATTAGAVSTLASFAVFFGGRDSRKRPANPIAGVAVTILAPLTASLIRMVVFRTHEFEADHGGATISSDSQALTSTLDKIHRYATGIPFVAIEAHPATAQMMIMSPLHGGGLASLLNTCPATGERITRLTQMAQTGQYPA